MMIGITPFYAQVYQQDLSYHSPQFRQDPTTAIEFIERTGGGVYAVGEFSYADGVDRPRIALLDDEGKLDLSFQPDPGLPVKMAKVRSDGKILILRVVVAEEYFSTEINDLILLNEDGSRDGSFHVQLSDFYPDYEGSIDSIQFLADDRILVRGDFYHVSGNGYFSYVLLNSDGSLDDSFIVSGVVNEGPYIGSSDPLLLLSDNKFLVYNSYWKKKRLIRLHSNGEIDDSFQEYHGVINSRRIVVYPDGRILFHDSDRGLIRLNPDGTMESGEPLSLDYVDDDNSSYYLNDLVLGSDEKITLRGTKQIYGFNHSSEVFHMRLLPDGTIDESFDLSILADKKIGRFQFTPSGNIYVTTYSNLLYEPEFLRLNLDGQIDVSFESPALEEKGTISQIFPLADGGQIINGVFDRVDGHSTKNITHLNADGKVNVGFRVDPLLQTKSSYYVHAISDFGDVYITSDGYNLGLTGRSLKVLDSLELDAIFSHVNLVKLRSDGDLDRDFTFYRTPPVHVIEDVKLDTTDNSLYILNRGVDYPGPYPIPPDIVIRYYPDGTIDESFPEDGEIPNVFTRELPFETERELSVFSTDESQSHFYENGSFVSWGWYPSQRIPGRHSPDITEYLLRYRLYGIKWFNASGEITKEIDLDESIGLKGPVSRDSIEDFDFPFLSDLHPLSDERILLSGHFPFSDGSTQKYVILNQNGTIDRNLPPTEWGLLMASDPDGAIYAWSSDVDITRWLHNEEIMVPLIVSPNEIKVGDTVTLTLSHEESGASYQWFFNGEEIVGATGSSLTIEAATVDEAGFYDVRISLEEDEFVSETYYLFVKPVEARLVAISARSTASSGEGTQIVGFVLSAKQRYPVLVRTVAEGMRDFGIENPLQNPQMDFYSGSTMSDELWDYGYVESLGYALKVTGAYIPQGSANYIDAGVSIENPARLYAINRSGSYTTHAYPRETGGGGVSLLEVYAVPGFEGLTGDNNMISLSCRSLIGSGEKVSIVGFVIEGNVPLKLLVRGIGPGLAPQGVKNHLQDPNITLYQGGEILARNDDWEESSNLRELKAAISDSGTFELTQGSKDAALFIELNPGIYTAVIGGAKGEEGIGLTELVVVPTTE